MTVYNIKEFILCSRRVNTIGNEKYLDTTIMCVCVVVSCLIKEHKTRYQSKNNFSLRSGSSNEIHSFIYRSK